MSTNTTVQVVSINQGIWFVASSKEKVKERIVREIGDADKLLKYENGDGDMCEGTVDDVIEQMYYMGGMGEMLKVFEPELVEMGDDYVDLAATNEVVDAE